MFIRNIRKSDYSAIDALLLQIHQVDVDGRPDMFWPIEQYMTRDSFESLVANKNVISILAQERGEITGSLQKSTQTRVSQEPPLPSGMTSRECCQTAARDGSIKSS